MRRNDDLYKILGVSEDASDDDIKKQYRKLAKELHPDLNPGDKECEERFKKITAAYDILGDSKKRQEYDSMKNHPEFNGGQGFEGFNFSGFNGFDPFKDFEMKFNQGFAQNKEGFVKNINLSIALDIYAVANGKNLSLDLQIDECCEHCLGSGKAEGTQEKICDKCSGTGQIRARQGNMVFIQPCRHCHGNGTIFDRCKKCSRAGVVPKNKKVEISIPKGISDGNVMTIRDNGHFSPGTKRRGNINIRVEILEHPFFKLANEDIHVQIPVSFKDAILGKDIKVPTLYGDAVLHVPPETQNGSTLLLSKMGVQHSVNNNALGNMYVHIIIDMPKGISDELREKIKEIDDSFVEYKISKDYEKIFQEINSERKSHES